MALEPVGGKYEGVWVNKLKNGDISYYIIIEMKMECL